MAPGAGFINAPPKAGATSKGTKRLVMEVDPDQQECRPSGATRRAKNHSDAQWRRRLILSCAFGSIGAGEIALADLLGQNGSRDFDRPRDHDLHPDA
jgi:hypothetical protein